MTVRLQSRLTRFSIGLLLALTPRLFGQGLESLHGFNTVLTEGRFSLTLHSRLRHTDPLGELYQARLGPILNVRLTIRISAIGGHYFSRQDDGTGNWTSQQRTFGGAELTPFRNSRFTIEGRSLVERFYGGPVDPYMRYRERVRITGPGRNLRPIGHAEVLFTQDRVLHRYMAGLRWQPAFLLTAETGYEVRISNGAAAHIIGTTLNFRPFRPKE